MSLKDRNKWRGHNCVLLRGGFCMPAAAGASNLILIVGVSLELIYFAAVCTLLYYNARLLVEICKKVCKVFKERDVQKKGDTSRTRYRN